MDARHFLGALALLTVGAGLPQNTEALECTGGTLGIDTRMLCSAVGGDTNLSTTPSSIKSWDVTVESPEADGLLTRSNTDSLKGYVSSVSTSAQSDYGINRASVQTSFSGPEAVVFTVNPANNGGVQSLWSDTLLFSGAPGQQVTLSGHVHASFSTGEDYFTNTSYPLGLQRLFYMINGYGASGVQFDNFAFGNTSILEVNGAAISGEMYQPFSLQLTLASSTGSVLIQSLLYVAAGGNRGVNAFGTASIDLISTPVGVTLATASNSLTQVEGGYRFAAAVPEPSTYVLMLLGLTVAYLATGVSDRKSAVKYV